MLYMYTAGNRIYLNRNNFKINNLAKDAKLQQQKIEIKEEIFPHI